MTPQEYEDFIGSDLKRPEREVHLKNKNDRTLLYGYDCDSHDWHVYIKAGVFHLICYEWASTPSKSRVIMHREFPRLLESDCESLIPNKRLYPAACDLEFCTLLSGLSVYLPFTTFIERDQRAFQGRTIEEVKPKEKGDSDDP